MSELSLSDIKEIRHQHVPARRGTICGWCLAPWPCRQARLLARIEELEKENDRLRRVARSAQASLPASLWYEKPLPPGYNVDLVRSLVAEWKELADALAALGGEDG